MNNSKKSNKLVRQNEKVVKKSQKHDANLRKNSTLYFQIGLIVCLLTSYTALEMTFASPGYNDYGIIEPIDNTIYEIVPENYIKEKTEVKKEPVKRKKQPEILIFKPVDNDTNIEDLAKNIITPTSDNPIKKVPDLNINDLDIEEPPTMVNIMAVQNVPVYPGCEKATNNDARRKCMSDKLSKLIQKKFNTDLASEYGLSGLQKIDVFFKINKQGEVVILNTRAPHPALDKEAKRIVEKIPTMKPGMNNKIPVEVSYNLPIKFNVRN